MHITSLPSEYGIGDFGENAYSFVDALSDNGVRLWQILPLGPTGYGDSPYAARSAFAGNELMISPRRLYLDGYLDIEDVMSKAIPSVRVDYGEARKLKMPLLRRAAESLLSSRGQDRKDYEALKRLLRSGKKLLPENMELILPDEYRNGRAFYDFTPRIIYKNSRRHGDSREMDYYEGKLNHLWVDIFILDNIPDSPSLIIVSVSSGKN